MYKTNSPLGESRKSHASQIGAFAVEFALVVLAFFTLLFGVIELARLVYLWNTLQEVTRNAARAAAYTDFRDSAAKDVLRQHAIFRTSAGKLVLGDPVTDGHVRIDYMALVRSSDGTLTMTPIPDAALPSCATRNRVTCTADPSNASCIRFVRVRICEPGGGSNCDPVPYAPLIPLIRFSSLTLPTSTTIVQAETLGYKAGQSLCP
jgi:Flp pilus assembly protein TadG